MNLFNVPLKWRSQPDEFYPEVHIEFPVNHENLHLLYAQIRDIPLKVLESLMEFILQCPPLFFSLRKGRCIRGCVLERGEFSSGLCKRSCTDLLRSSHHQAWCLTEGSGILHSLCRPLLTESGANLQPEEEGECLDHFTWKIKIA